MPMNIQFRGQNFNRNSHPQEETFLKPKGILRGATCGSILLFLSYYPVYWCLTTEQL